MLNLGWAGLTLLAGWCVGHRRGVGPVTLGATAVVLSLPVIADGAGTAHSDVPSLFFLLAAVAVLVHGPLNRRVVALAALSAGLGIATKLTLVAPIAVLTLGLLLVVGRRRRWDLAAAWLAPMVALGGFWFLRNLVRTGSPLPSISLGIGPVAFPKGRFPVVDEVGYSVADYLTHGDIWRDVFLPGLGDGFGPLWWGLLALAVVGSLWTVARGESPSQRWLGVVALVAGVAYLFTPLTAGGQRGRPTVFLGALRYAGPAILIGLVCLALVPRLRGRAGQAALLALFAVLVVSTFVPDSPIDGWPSQHRRGAIVTGILMTLLAAAVVAAARLQPRLRLRLGAAGVALVAAGGLVAGHRLQQRYVDGRYASPPTWAWADDVGDQRIAVAGFNRQYPYFGVDLSNRVRTVGERGPHGAFDPIGECDRFLARLREGRFGYVVVGSDRTGERRPVEAAWIADAPDATALVRDDLTTVFRLEPTGDEASTGCPE